MRKLLFIFTLLLLTSALAMSQVRQITGTVTSQDDGLPLPGVSVTVKGTTVGSLTDVNGKYAISTSDNQTLIYSFVGMKPQEILVSGQTVIDIVLTSDLMKLDEVVVVGYGTAKKVGTVVGSLTQVNSKTVEEKPVANIMDALQGKVAGLTVLTSSGEPTAIASIRLHGNGSLSGSTTPLYVLDGTPIDEGTMLSLNSNDFESVTILKDASANSIYGTRAANGVIYITTKRGTLDSKGKIKISLIKSFSSIADETFYKSFMNTSELTNFWVTAGYRTQAQVDALLASYPNDTQWYKYYYKNSAPALSADVSISGGGGKTTYYVSGSYFNSNGIADRSLYERYTLRSNINTKVNNWFSMGANLLGSSDKRENNAYGTNSTNRGLALLAQPFYTPIDPNTGKEYPDIIPGWNRYNPKYLAAKLPQVGKNYQFDATGFMQINPIEGLTIKTQAGMDAYDFYQFTKRMPSYKGSLNNGSLTEEYYQGVTSTITNTAEYKFSVADKHNFTLLIGQEGIGHNYHGFTAASTGQTDDRLMELENGPNGKTNTSVRTAYAFLSYFGRIDYSLLDKYFFDFSARQDACSRFGKDNRTANFYAAGAMWNAKKESFLADVKFLSSLNIKLSVGTSGNAEGLGDYAHLATIGANQYDSSTGWVVSSPGNSRLGWESQILSTLGFKFGLFNDSYRFNVELYNRVTTDMLVDVPYPYTSGFPSIYGNVGKLRNRGIDVAIDFDIVKTKDYYITPYLNFNYNKEEILDLFQDYPYWIIPNTGTCWAVGKPVSYFYPLWAGVNPDDGYGTWYVPGEDITKTTRGATTEDFNSDDLQQNLGKPVTPPLNGGFGLSMGYKGFSVQADFTFSWNKYLINNDRYFFENPDVFAGYNQVRRIQDFWQQPGDKTLFPAFGTQFTQFDSRLCENASFMRLKYLSLSYSVPSDWLAKTKFFSGAKVYVAGRNLWTLTNYLGPDPEIDSNLSLGAYPNTKQILFGVEVTF
jgi:TonB-linked SusC/RagA family outer membrane protein